jgi:hypothetical protein
MSVQKAPKHNDLSKLLKARLEPNKIDKEWFRGGNGLVLKLFVNLLENPNANIVQWDEAQYNIWQTEAESRQQRERNDKEEAEAKARTHSQE